MKLSLSPMLTTTATVAAALLLPLSLSVESPAPDNLPTSIAIAPSEQVTIALRSATAQIFTQPVAKLTHPAPSPASAVNPGRLTNLSILTTLTDATDTFTIGAVVGGASTIGPKPLLVRAAGPSLTALGVTDVVNDPKLEVFTGATKVGENDDWGGDPATVAAMDRVGAFAFSSPLSRDAAISLPALARGASSARISGTGAGTVLAELYDASTADAFLATTPRLTKVWILKNIGAGVTAGFVIGGNTERTVLIRAIGPTMETLFGIEGAIADPRLALYSGQTQLAANDNWGGDPTLAAISARSGAFPLPAKSRDAALLLTLQPGAYTLNVAGTDGLSGIALIEIYEVPE